MIPNPLMFQSQQNISNYKQDIAKLIDEIIEIDSKILEQQYHQQQMFYQFFMNMMMNQNMMMNPNMMMMQNMQFMQNQFYESTTNIRTKSSIMQRKKKEN